MLTTKTMAGFVVVAGVLLGSGRALAQFGVPITDPVALNANAATDSGSDAAARVNTDGAGNWVAVWVTGDSLNGTIGAGGDILVARSTDNGVSWDGPAALNSNAATNVGEPIRGLEAATDGSGNLVVVWGSTDTLGGTIGTDTDILVARSSDNGATWTPVAALNTDAGTDNLTDGFPQIASDGAGNWVTIWQSDGGVGSALGFDSDILVSRSVDNGATWTAPVPLNTNAAIDGGDDLPSQIVTDGLGTWIAVWWSRDSLGGQLGVDIDILVARSTDNGTNWTAPVPLNTNAGIDSGDDLGARIAQDGSGHWVAVWSSSDDLGGTTGMYRDILVAHSSNNGMTWSDPVALNRNAVTSNGTDFSPSIATDGAGSWVTVWSSADDLGATIGPDFDILVSRSTDRGINWTLPSALNTNAASGVRGFDADPRVLTDGAGNWVSTWNSTSALNDLGRNIGEDWDVLVARFTLGICGNGIVEMPEQCDDGNLANGDGCSSSCGTFAVAGIPTVSEWGLVVVTLLILTAGTMVLGRIPTAQPDDA